MRTIRDRLRALRHADVTDDREFQAVAQRVEQEEREAEKHVRIHVFQRQQNHFGDRIAAAFRDDLRRRERP